MIIFFLIFPTLTFLYCFAKNVRSKWIPILFVLDILFYCLHFHLEAYDGWSGDITRNLEHIIGFKDYSLKELFMQKDYFFPLTSKLLSNITDNKTIYILFYGTIFAVLNWMTIRIVLKHFTYIKTGSIQYLFLLSLVLVYSCLNLNSLRFALATVYFLWCILEIALNNNKRFYLYILLSPTIHFAYWFFILVPILWFFLKGKLRTVQIVFLASFLFVTPQVASIINSYSVLFNDKIVESVDVYAGEGMKVLNEGYEDLAKKGNLNRMISRNSVEARNYAVGVGFFLISVMGFRYLKSDVRKTKLITLVLLAFALANIASSVSNGVRYFHTVCAIGIYVIVALLYEWLTVDEKEYYSIPRKFRFIMVTMCSLACFNSILFFYIGRIGSDLDNFIFGNWLSLLFL